MVLPIYVKKCLLVCEEHTDHMTMSKIPISAIEILYTMQLHKKLFRCIHLTYFYMCKIVYAKKILEPIIFELSNFIAKCQAVFPCNCSMYTNKFLLIFKI